MNRFLKKSALALAALLAVGAAHATVITFDGPDLDTSYAPFAPSFITDGDALLQGGFAVIGFNNNNTSGSPDGSLVGALVDGTQVAATCSNVSCPTNDATTFYASVDDGVVALQAVDGGTFTLNSLQASFVAPAGASIVAAPGSASLLGIQAVYGPGPNDYDYISLALPGTTNGNLQFSSLSMNGTALAGKAYEEIYLFGYACDASGNCSAFSTNQGQFALDNIDVSEVAAVPEPSQWTLIAAGLGVVGGIARRRRRAA